MAWSGFGQMHLVQNQVSVQESLSLIQADGPLQVSHFQTWLHSSTDSSDHIVQNQPGSEQDCLVRFGQTLLVQKQASVQESLGLLLASASEPIQIRCESDVASLLG